MRESLFRKQALNQQQTRLEGEVLLLQPVSQPVLVGVLCIIVGLAITLLAKGNFARQEAVQGVLVPDKGILKIYAPQPAIVTQVLVKEGQRVHKGQTLALLGNTRFSGNGEQVLTQQLNMLKQQHQLLSNQIAHIPNQFSQLRQQIISENEGHQLQLEHLLQQQNTNQQQQSLQLEQLNAVDRLLANKHLSKVQHAEVKKQYLARVNEGELIAQQQTQHHQQIRLLRHKLSDLDRQQQVATAQLQSQLIDIKKLISDSSAQLNFALRAEQDGIVSTIQIHQGQQVDSQQPLITLLPKNSQLLGEMLVPSTAIGFIQPGQRVSLKYAAFPYQKFGSYQGIVAKISKNVLIPSEWKQLPININRPSYKVTVAIEQQAVEAYGKQFSLQPGIAFDAHVRLDERSLIEWFLEPVLSLKGRFSS